MRVGWSMPGGTVLDTVGDEWAEGERQFHEKKALRARLLAEKEQREKERREQQSREMREWRKRMDAHAEKQRKERLEAEKDRRRRLNKESALAAALPTADHWRRSPTSGRLRSSRSPSPIQDGYVSSGSPKSTSEELFRPVPITGRVEANPRPNPFESRLQIPNGNNAFSAAAMRYVRPGVAKSVRLPPSFALGL